MFHSYPGYPTAYLNLGPGDGHDAAVFGAHMKNYKPVFAILVCLTWLCLFRSFFVSDEVQKGHEEEYDDPMPEPVLADAPSSAT